MRHRLDPLALLMGVAAFVWHVLLLSTAVNDNFMHMAMAQQWLGGDWPVRDFFGNGRLLQYSLSALAQLTVGERLLGEALIVGIAWAISAYVVFLLVRQLTDSVPAAFLASLLLIVAGARGYSYPKGIVYAVAAVLWWAYVRRPRRATIVAFGAWVAVSYYWRPDHGIYAAFGLALAVLTAHGIRREAITRAVVAGLTTLALVIPFWAYVQATVGLANYVRTGRAGLESEHEIHGRHVWPLLRFGVQVIAIEPPDQYAPVISIRWSAASAPEARQAVRDRYGLTTLETEGDSERVRLSPRAVSEVAAIVREPIVEDTGGIDRSSGALDPERWPAAQRRKFEHAWLRLQVLPQLDARERHAEFTVAFFLLLPLIVIVGSPLIAPRLAPGLTAWQVGAFGTFAFAVAYAMLREPFTARAADAVVLNAVAFALGIVALWRAGRGGGRPRTVVSSAAAVVLSVLVTSNVAATGQVGPFMDSLTRGWTSNPLRGVWETIDPEFTATPPLARYIDHPARVTLRLAAYAKGCVPESERVLVLWFEPEIPYFSGRLLGQRHFVFPPAWATLAHEQRATLEKAARYKPPMAFALASALDGNARPAFPGLVDYVEREYQQAVTLDEGGERYIVFTRKDRPVISTFGSEGWPCFTADASPWDRVGWAPE